MLSEPFGNPLMVDVRGRPGVLVPGKSNTKSNASREVNGVSVIWQFLDEQHLLSGFGELAANDPANRPCPAYNKTHRVLSF